MGSKLMSFQELVEIAKEKNPGQLMVRVEEKGSSLILPAELLKYINLNSVFFDGRRDSGGKILLPSEAKAIAATTPVLSTFFNTYSYKYLLLCVTNPTWATNPASITVTVLFSVDDGGTYFTLSLTATGGDAGFSLDTTDGSSRCYFVPIVEVGDKHIGNCPFPSFGDLNKIAFLFTPAGSAESQVITISVYGVG